MPHLMRVASKHREMPHERYPFSVPAIRTLSSVDVHTGVTFFVGENGSGKSTLLEGIASASELMAIGSRDTEFDDTLGPARELGAALRLSWSRRSREGFFMRAEDFFGFHKSQARTDARIARERFGPPLSSIQLDNMHPDEHLASRLVAGYDSDSHGESFMALFAKRIRPGGLYLLDEPEAPLSPKRQIELLKLLLREAASGAQFIIATHSPILLSCPNARLFDFDVTPIAPAEYESLDHVTVTREFLRRPSAFLDDE